jgi:hypothetical protein
MRLTKDGAVVTVRLSGSGIELSMLGFEVNYIEAVSSKQSLNIAHVVMPSGISGNPEETKVKYKFETSRLPIISMNLYYNDNAVVLDLEPNIIRLSTCVLPMSDEEYSSVAIRRELRWGDAMTDYITSRQMAIFYPGFSGYRVAAGVVMCYKACELNDQDLSRDALEVAGQLLEIAKSCPTDWHPRRNGEHLYISLLMSMWHIHLSTGSAQGMVECLQKIQNHLPHVTNFLTPSYIISKSMLILGYIYFVRGDHENARSAWMAVFTSFRRGVSDADVRRVVLVEELGVAHKCAVVASLGLQVLSGRGGRTVGVDDILSESLRVKGKCLERMKQNFKRLFVIG